MKRHQFSLRTMLFFIAIIALFMASLKYHEPALTLAGAQGVTTFAVLRLLH